MKRTLLVALVLGSLAPATLVLSRAAEAAACSGTTGVTVVVQFPDHTEVACAPGDPTSGFEALQRAGFDVTRVTKFPGAVCRIDGIPTAEQDPCVNMPPASAYWTYFHAKPGGTWNPSNVGADGYDPKPGSVEGWRYGDGAAPSTPPPGSAPAPKPSPTATPASSTTGQQTTPRPAPSSTGRSAAAAPGASGGSTPSGTATPGSSASASATPSASATASTGPSAAPTELDAVAGPAAVEIAESAEPATGGASWVWGVALLAVLLAIGGAVAYRRRT